MALDQNEIVSQGWWNQPDDIPDGVALPDGVEKSNDYYAYYRVYRDGRREIEWRKRGSGDGKNDPILTTSSDSVPAIKAKWDDDTTKDKAATRAEQGGVTQEGATRGAQTGPTREVYRSGQWVTEQNPTYQQPATTPHTEGTPIPGGGFDNSKPIMVNRDANGQQVGAARALTADERAQWERDQNGGKSNAETQAATQKADTTEVSSEYVGTGKNRKKITTYQSGRKVTEDAATNATATAVTYDPDGTKVTKYDDGTETREAKPPTAGQIVKGAGPNGEDMQAVTGPDGKVSYQPIAGAPKPNGLPSDLPQFVPTISKPAMGIIEFAQQINQLASMKNQDGSPKITDAQKNAILASAHADALAEANRLDTIRATQQQSQTNEITQRDADLNASVSRGAQANQATEAAMTTGATLMKMMSPSSLKSADAIVPGLLGTAYQQAGQWGGLSNPAPVDASKYPALQALNQLGINPAPPSGADVANQTNATMAQSNNAFGHALGQPAGAPAAPQGPLPPIGPSNLFPTPQAPPGTPTVGGMMPDANQPPTPQPGQPPAPGDPNAPVGMAQPSWGPMQHPAVAQTMGQPPDPSIDPQAWQNAVAQASRMLGMG